MQVVSSDFFARRRCAMVIGHPGHELRVWGWLQAARPLVFILTDGSGHGEQSRLDLTRELIRSAGAQLCESFEILTDERMYRAIRTREYPLFRSLSGRIAAQLVEHEIDCLAGDASEGYNPTHDVCRLIADRAIRTSGVEQLDNYAFSLVGTPAPDPDDPRGICLELNSSQLGEKLAAVRKYARDAGGTLLSEIEGLIGRYGEQAFRSEYLSPVDAWLPVATDSSSKPFYETHGERQVAAGRYDVVIRLRDHVVPIATSLQS
jgi:hypothetical protein